MAEEGSGTEESGEVEGQPAWAPPASQEELDRIIQERLTRATKKFKDYDSLAEKASRLDALESELSSETEKAVKAARDDERSKAGAEFTPRLVKSEFRAQAKGVLSDDQLGALLEDLDLSRYATADGDVDVDKVTKKIAAIAPKKEERQFPDLGGGRRGGAPAPNNMNALIRRAAGIG